MTTLTCEHDNTKLSPIADPKSGTYYLCKKCGCTYRLILVRSDKDCYAKRHPQQTPTTKPSKGKHK